MEEKRDYRQQNNIQKFYFNEDGQLVVESNKGVWVDGDQYVKMYGNFTCNARTMGMIIHQLKGIPVEIAEMIYATRERTTWYNFDKEEGFYNDYFNPACCCVLGVSEERIKEYEEKLAEKHYTNLSIDTEKLAIQQEKDSCKSEIETLIKAYSHLRDKVISFNSLPWYKSMFKKIEIK